MRSLLIIIAFIACSNVFAGKCSFFYVPGMQQVAEDSFDGADSSAFPSLKHTINISGIVDSTAEAQFLSECIRHGVPYCSSVTVHYQNNPLYNNSASEESWGCAAWLENATLSYEIESPMSKKADSRIIYPCELNLNIGDTIYIKNYSVLYYEIWDEYYKCDIDPKIEAIGEYTVIPQQQTKILPPAHTKKFEPTKIYNRDASGRFNNGKNKYIIRY